MEYKEYGSKNSDIIILLHGGGLSWWNYIDEISLLENEFHIVIPILDGHSGSDTNFTSIESNALEIINFINKNYNGKVKLIGGLSLGGQILLEILSKNPDIDIKEVLDTPKETEDIITVCDNLITSLSHAENNASKMIAMLQNMKASNYEF